MTLMLALALLQDAGENGSRTWSFELKFDTIERVARLAGGIKKDHDRGRLTWHRWVYHVWYAVDRKEALRMWNAQLRRLSPQTRRRVLDAAGKLWKAFRRSLTGVESIARVACSSS